MNQFTRLVAFLALALAAIAVFAFFGAAPAGSETAANTLLFASLLLASFAVLLMEHWFTKPTDAIATSIAILLSLLPAREALIEMGYAFNSLIALSITVIAAAAFSILLEPLTETSKFWDVAVERMRRFATTIGASRFQFVALFFACLITYVDRQSTHFIALLAYAGVVLAIDPKSLPSIVLARPNSTKPIGEVIGVQSRNTILAKLAKNREAVGRYDFVEFGDAGDDNKRRQGIIIDNWVLNSEQWIKIFSGSLISDQIGESEHVDDVKPGKVYKILPKNREEILQRFVGTVHEGSEILSIRFDYGMKVPVTEGSLLEVETGKTKVLYQVTQGVTHIEKLDAKNEAGLIIGHASQLGVWNGNDLKFDRFGWVPEINKPVLLAADIDEIPPPDGEMLIGTVPNTRFPVFMNKSTAVNCHMAVVGVTGTGKSVFSRNLLRTFANDGMKVIAVDFTGEYRRKLTDMAPKQIMTDAEAKPLFEMIDWINDHKDTKRKWQWDTETIGEYERQIQRAFAWSIWRLLYSNDNIAIFELPDVSNSNSTLSYTRWFFKVLFQLAKDKRLNDKQFCVTLEEAHTVVPESNFVSVDDWGAKALLNQISQIALQGRKYGVGFVVIAQRTANVSKTVLTQCNTLIAFQQFDKTSAEFLANYMGYELTRALPNLPPRRAIAVGKAFRSGLPMIFDVPEIQEP